MLNNTQLMEIAPSIFATTPHEDVSDKYKFIPTSTVLDIFRDHGWNPVMAMQQKVRTEGRRGYQKHLIRLRHESQSQLGDHEALDMLLTNAHDRSAAFHIHAAIFRFICSNGMVVADSTLQHASIRHIGFDEAEVLGAIYDVEENTSNVAGAIDQWREIRLDAQEQHVFGRAAALTRWDADKVPVTPQQLIQPRRNADVGDDLWTVYNRVQENLMKGGLNTKKRRTRKITSIDADTKINKALWELTAGMAELKQS